MDIIRKVYAVETKDADPETGDVNVFIPLSTGSVDRDGEQVLPTAFKKNLANFRKRPILISSHDYQDLRKQIGEFRSIKVDETGLWGKPRYYVNQGNDEADWGFFLASIGKAAYSIGFLPFDWEENPEADGVKDPKKIFTEAELLEVSHVIVPSNRDAAQSMKLDLTTKGIKIPKDYQKALDEVITKLGEIDKDEILKPYPNEHSCRINDPGKYDKFSRENCGQKHDEKCIDVIYGIKEGKSEIQALRYKIDIWDETAARNHCKTRDGTFEPANKGITIYNCECIECGYKMESEMHCSDIKCPKCGGQMRRIERPGPGKGIEEIKSVIPFKHTPLASEDAEWDAGAEVRAAEVEDLKVMCTVIVGDPENKTSYKLPHHRSSGEHACVWRGVAAAGAVMMGARGGVDISEADRAGVKAHLVKHYKEFDKVAPWEETESPKELSWKETLDEIDYAKSLVTKEVAKPEIQGAVWEMVEIIMGFPGGQIPVKIEQKVGAVLNAKNKENLRQAQALIQTVIDSAEPREPEKNGMAENLNGKIAAGVLEALKKYNIRP